MQARVVKVSGDDITLEVESQLIFNIRYRILIDNWTPSPGDLVEFEWGDRSRESGVEITRLLSARLRTAL